MSRGFGNYRRRITKYTEMQETAKIPVKHSKKTLKTEVKRIKYAIKHLGADVRKRISEVTCANQILKQLAKMQGNAVMPGQHMPHISLNSHSWSRAIGLEK